MKILTCIARAILNFIYTIMKLSKVRRKVLFLSRQADSPSLDIMMLADEIKREHPDYEALVLCKKIGGGFFGTFKYCFHMLKQMKELATSEVVILDSYSIVISLLKHRKSLRVIQMWHSVGTMKKFGYSILDKPEGTSKKVAEAMRMHKNYDYILCAGEGYKSHIADGFGYTTDIVKILPLPRVEALQDEAFATATRKKVFAQYPELAGDNKKNILYVPTFRKGKEEEKEFKEAVSNLIAAFEPYNGKYNLIVKAHPLSGVDGMVFTAENGKALGSGITSFDMLFAADYVISDYSCIIYEAAILHLPLFFYTYDFETYLATRDMYIDYKKEIPNDMYADPTKLFEAIDNGHFDMARQDAFLKKYVDYERPHITSDIVQLICF